MATAHYEGPWLLLIHQIPTKPDYLRVKIWRRLQRLGAVAVKNSVYVLPKSEQAQEDFQWVLREVKQAGGDAMICETRFVEGLTEDTVEQMFRSAREADYEAILKEADRTGVMYLKRGNLTGERKSQLAVAVERLQRRLAEVAAIDFFGAPGREGVERAIYALETRLQNQSRPLKAALPEQSLEGLQGRTWVTRKGIYVDRMACAWLIRRFIDPKAQFKFVPAKGYRPEPDEIRFDMYEGEFTHEGDRCTFEVLMSRFGLSDSALQAIAEMVHDIDLKDSKFSRQETHGIDRLIAGIAMAHKDDEARLSRAAAVFDDLNEYYKRKRK